MPLSLKRDSAAPLRVSASMRELPVARTPPAESEMFVPSGLFAIFGASPGAFGASTSAFASGGGVPIGGSAALADGEMRKRADAATKDAPTDFIGAVYHGARASARRFDERRL